MKKHIALIMALLILLSTVLSCGSSESSNTQTEEGKSSTDAVISSKNPENSSDQPVITSQPEQTVTESPNTTNSPEQTTAELPVTTNLPEQTSGQTEPAITEHVHSFGTEWKTDAYSHWHTCSCGENSQFAAHSFGEWVVAKAATEQVVGAEYRICATCGYKEEKTIPVLGHTHRFGTEWQSDDVKHWHVCECGEKTDNASHSFGEWIVDTEATCTEAGSRHHVCSVCGKNVSEVIPAKGHTLVTDTGKPATCTEAGISDGKHCSVCQTVISAQKEIPAKGHIVVTDKAVAATCTADGLTEGSHCSVCNVVLKAQEKVNALGHNFVDGVCSRCGDAYPLEWELLNPSATDAKMEIVSGNNVRLSGKGYYGDPNTAPMIVSSEKVDISKGFKVIISNAEGFITDAADSWIIVGFTDKKQPTFTDASEQGTCVMIQPKNGKAIPFTVGGADYKWESWGGGVKYKNIGVTAFGNGEESTITVEVAKSGAINQLYINNAKGDKKTNVLEGSYTNNRINAIDKTLATLNGSAYVWVAISSSRVAGRTDCADLPMSVVVSTSRER